VADTAIVRPNIAIIMSDRVYDKDGQQVFCSPLEFASLSLCVTSGQVFRWTQGVDGVWLGVDGEAWYRVDHGEIRSNQGPDNFARLFRLDTDMSNIQAELLHRGPELEPYFEAVRGLRLLRPSDPVETFFSFLCTANNHIARIGGMVRYLASLGEKMDTVDGEVVRRFPAIEVIAGVTEEDLRAHGFGYRGATIPEVAKELLRRGGRNYLLDLKKGGYEEAHAELVTIKSVGRKLADCICLFALHHDEAAPIDTHIWQATTRLYFPEWSGSALTDKKYAAVGSFLRNRFGDLTGWAQQFLFYENVVNWRKRK